MEKIRLDIEPLAVESFVVEAADRATVAAHEAGPTRACGTTLCTAGVDCL